MLGLGADAERMTATVPWPSSPAPSTETPLESIIQRDWPDQLPQSVTAAAAAVATTATAHVCCLMSPLLLV